MKEVISVETVSGNGGMGFPWTILFRSSKVDLKPELALEDTASQVSQSEISTIIGRQDSTLHSPWRVGGSHFMNSTAQTPNI